MNSMYIASIVYVQTALFGYINSYPDYMYTYMYYFAHAHYKLNKMSLRSQCATSILKLLHVPSTCMWLTKQEKNFV